ncbi:hypothetical protein [Winogradskyella forsetii]|uniref:hypothetical protein n=1 Tax=Winogradskyella forsetii TaxID=2686077 RepID=UPI0015C1822E|nr:hypothetical protein [Winogradskyella forsetii]
MKKLVIIALALVSLNAFAQRKEHNKMDRENRSELRKDMTPSDIADLKSKQLTLKLDLTDTQQKDVHQLIFDEATTRQSLRKANKSADGEKRAKPSKEDIVKMQNQRLDSQIEMKRKMKKILTEEQYAKFEKMKLKKHNKRRKHNINN